MVHFGWQPQDCGVPSKVNQTGKGVSRAIRGHQRGAYPAHRPSRDLMCAGRTLPPQRPQRNAGLHLERVPDRTGHAHPWLCGPARRGCPSLPLQATTHRRGLGLSKAGLRGWSGSQAEHVAMRAQSVAPRRVFGIGGGVQHGTGKVVVRGSLQRLAQQKLMGVFVETQ